MDILLVLLTCIDVNGINTIIRNTSQYNAVLFNSTITAAAKMTIHLNQHVSKSVSFITRLLY